MVDTASFDRFTSPDASSRKPDSRTRAFEAAARHSRMVRWLRKAIPLSIVAVVGLTILVRFFNPFRTIVPDVQVSSIGISGSKLTMEQPKLSGFKKDSKAYEVVAEAASQDIKKPNIVELKLPVARIEVRKGSWVRLSAETGVYDTTTEKLVVNDKVTVKDDNGLDMRLSQANVDFKTGNMSSDNPVEVDMRDGWVKSDRMNVVENGKSIVFEGRVRSEFKAAAVAPASGTSEEKPAQ